MLLDVTVRYDPVSDEIDVGPEALQLFPGGSAANFAVGAARLGAEVRFVGSVGRDLPGEMLVRLLKSEGIVTSVRVIEGETTGRVLVMVDPSGHRRMWSYPGASSRIDRSDLDPAWFEGLAAFHLTGYSLLREGPREAAHFALQLARRSGAFCLLDPNPGHLIADYGPQRFRALLRELQFDAIFPNIEEGALLTGHTEPAGIVESLLEVAPIVALTLGEAGCLVAEGRRRTRGEGGRPERVVDATGAGDAFAAAFVVEYLTRHDLQAAADAANLFAAEVVGRAGGR